MLPGTVTRVYSPSISSQPAPAQRGTGSEIDQPVIESGALLADAARPEPIHQRPKAVRGIRIVVDALDLNAASVRELVRRTFALRSHGSSNPACHGEYSGERRCGVCACEGSDLGLIEE